MVRVRHVLLACVALMGGCVGELIEVPDEGGPGEETEDLAPLELTVNAPVYGEFTGGDSVLVEGTVVPLSAELWIEDEAVEVTEEGAFSVELPIEGDYRIVDVLASSGDEEQSERIPVFSGNPPADTWTGGLTGRLLPAGMERLGPQIGPMIDDLGWADSIAPSLPSYSGNYLTLTPTGITHERSENTRLQRSFPSRSALPTRNLMKDVVGRGRSIYMTCSNMSVRESRQASC